MTFSVGVDVGGTNTVVGLLDEEGRVIGIERISTLAASGPDPLFDRIAASIRALLDRAGISVDRVTVGMGIPGFVDREAGIALNSGNLAWRGVPVVAAMRQRLGRPVSIDNDVRMYVYGEALRGAGVGFRHVLGVTVGTGLAAAYYTDGRFLYGGGDMAGELGHLPIESIPYPCVCGLIGCLETVASATGIVRLTRDLIARERLASTLPSRFPGDGLPGLTAMDVSAACEDGDPAAAEAMRRAGHLLGQGLAYASTLLSPDVIIIGGGVAAAGDTLLAPMRGAMEQLIMRDYRERLTIIPAVLGDQAGLIGSALYGRERAAETGAPPSLFAAVAATGSSS